MDKKVRSKILAQSYMQLEDYYFSSNQNSTHHQFNMQLGGLPPIDESEDDNSSNWNQLEDYHQSTNGRAPRQQLGSIGAIAFTHLLYMLIKIFYNWYLSKNYYEQ